MRLLLGNYEYMVSLTSVNKQNVKYTNAYRCIE